MRNELLVRWGEVVRAERRALRLTQAMLAKDVGIAGGYLSHIELGNAEPSVEVKVRLARALRVQVGDLFPYPLVAGDPTNDDEVPVPGLAS